MISGRRIFQAATLFLFMAVIMFSAGMAQAKPVVPSDLTALAISKDRIVLGWQDNSIDEMLFKIQTKTGNCDSIIAWTDAGSTSADATVKTISGLLPVTEHSYRIKAVDANGISSLWSGCVSATPGSENSPASPQGLVAKSTNTTTVTLTWADKSADETGFRIWRKIGESAFGFLTTTAPGVKKYVDSNAADNRGNSSYSYYLQACKGAVCSPKTADVMVPNPHALTLTTFGQQINLAWLDDASGYSVYSIERKNGHCADSSVAWIPLDTGGMFIDKDLTAGATYGYRVKGVYQSPQSPLAKGYSWYTPCREITYQPSAPAGAVDLPETGQTTCYDPAGNVTGCGFSGQDGAVQAGEAWPKPRFVSGAGAEADCMIDTLTGLMWPKNGNLAGVKTWQKALTYARNLNLCGHTDWRLPNVNEQASLANIQEPNPGEWLNTRGFYNIRSDAYWSSTTNANYTFDAWIFDMSNSSVYSHGKSYVYGVWPVRAAQSGTWGDSVIELPRTGQTTCYQTVYPWTEIACAGTGQDGAIQAGADWPTPRFVPGTGAEGNCMTDSLTGLMWPKNGRPVGMMTWQEALAYAGGLNLCGHSDWRLPNLNEQASLLNREEPNPAVWLNTQGFRNIKLKYWSSSTYATATDDVWYAALGLGDAAVIDKGGSNYVWPVRGGH